MGRIWQYFMAPGEETEPLPIPKSAWWTNRRTHVPKEYWQLIMEFASSINPEKAAILVSYAEPEGEGDEEDIVHPAPEELVVIIAFVEELSKAIAVAPPLVPEDSKEYPHQYSNEDLTRMVEAVAAVLREALRMQQPFEAWTDR